MPRILPTTIDDAPTATQPLLQQLKTQLGMVPQLFATIGRSPAALRSLLEAAATLADGALSAAEIEAVNLRTSELNGCGYCVSAHAMLGKRAGLDATAIAAARRGTPDDPRIAAMLDLVTRVVRTGGAGAGSELARLRAAGVDDAAIVEVLAHAALKTFTNAVALVAQTEIDFPRPPDAPTP